MKTQRAKTISHFCDERSLARAGLRAVESALTTLSRSTDSVLASVWPNAVLHGMRVTLALTLLVTLLATLGGCGQKGPLKPAEAKTSRASSAAGAAAPAAAQAASEPIR